LSRTRTVAAVKGDARTGDARDGPGAVLWQYSGDTSCLGREARREARRWIGRVSWRSCGTALDVRRKVLIWRSSALPRGAWLGNGIVLTGRALRRSSQGASYRRMVRKGFCTVANRPDVAAYISVPLQFPEWVALYRWAQQSAPQRVRVALAGSLVRLVIPTHEALYLLSECQTEPEMFTLVEAFRAGVRGHVDRIP